MSWPRRITLGLLVALPLLLVAALWFGPRLTDWNEHRDRLAILAAGRLGQPVKLSGSVKLGLLPQPMLEAGGVTIGGPDSGLSIQARALRLRLDLGALLRFRLEPREVVLVGAEIRLPWPPTSGQPFRPPPWLTELRGRIEDSRIIIGSVVLERVTAELAAGAATDALKIDGRFRWRNLDTTFQTTLGRPGWDDAAPMDLTLSAANASLSTSGVLLPEGGFEGSLQGGGSDLSALVPGPPGEFRLRGRISATADLLTASELTMDIAGSPVRGVTTLRLAPAPRLDVAMVAGRVSLDPWVAALRNAGPPALPFGLDLSAEAATLRGQTLRRLRGAALLEGEKLTLSDVSAVLPGDTEVELSGSTTGRLGANGRLEAGIRFRGTALRATLAALGLDLSATDPTLLRQGDGRLRLVLEESQAAIPEFVATLDGARVSGAGVLRFGARPALGLGLTFDRLDLDGWLPRGTDPLALALRPSGFDANLRIAAEQAQWRGLMVDRFTLDGALEGGRLTARRIAARVAGAEVAVSGQLSPGANSGAPPRLTDGALDLSAPIGRPLLALLPGTWEESAVLAMQPLALRLSANGPLNALVLRGGLDMGEARMEASGTLDAQALRYAGNVTLRHPGAFRLIAEASGLQPPLWIGDGSLSLIANVNATPQGGQVENFDLVAGEIRLGGQLALAMAAGSRPRLTGRLAAETLPLPRPNGLGTPIDLAPLSLLDAELAVTVGRVLPPLGPVWEQGVTTLRLNGGVLQLDGTQARVNGGQVQATARLDSTASPPTLATQFTFDGVGLHSPLTGLPLDLTAGQLEGKADLRTAGYSPEAMLSGLEGTAELVAQGGVLAGTDLGATLRAAGAPEPAAAETALRAALLEGATAFERLEGRVTISGGRLRVEEGTVSIAEHKATLSGEADLAHGGVNLSLSLQPPQGPALGLNLTGSLAQPRKVPDIADWLRWRAEQP